jgi:hypothetical protein
MWHYYNPNPMLKNTGDCTVRAVCAVTGLSWRAAHDALCALSGEMCDMPDTTDVWWTFLRGIGYERIAIPNRCPDCYTVLQFAAEHPLGKYIIGPYRHAVAVIDGDWWDSWDSGDTVPYYYFEQTEGTKNGHEILSGLSTVPAAADGDSDTAADKIC